MKASRVGLLLVILGFGAAVETAWSLRNHLGIGAAGCRILGGKFYGPSFSFEAEGRNKVPEGTAVEVENAFGGVRIGRGSLGEVRVGLRKVVFLPSEGEARSFAADVRLTTTLVGSTLRVSTNRRELGSRDVGFETHLEVEVPPGTTVTVRNEHGPVDVADVAGAEIESGYDAVRVDRVGGATSLKSRHGDVAVSDIKGPLVLSSRHGDVEVRDVGGRAQLEVEHGDVSLARLGDLTLKVRHGDLTAEAIRGDFEVHGEHAGVKAVDVAGRAVVETAYRSVDLQRIGGEARVKTEHGEIGATDVRGAVFAEATYDDVTLVRIGGPVEVTVNHGGLHAEKLARGARVKAFGDDVLLDGFRGPVEIDARRGGVRLVPDGALVEAVSVSTTNGGIWLEVPGGSRFDLDASAQRGEVQVDLEGFTAGESGAAHVAGKLGGGGELVKLAAEQGDVSVATRSETASKVQ